jgi:hypothetical protein
VSQSWNKRRRKWRIKDWIKGEKMSRQTLTHCGKYLDQNQEADFHLGLVQSAKWKSKKGKKKKEKNEKKKGANQDRIFVLYLPIQ